jgi:GPH family glycoside/pentoside/hexuronide:cation symporter
MTINVIAAMINFYLKYFFKNEGFIPFAYTILFTVTAASMFIWIILVNRFGKRKMSITANLCYAAIVSTIIFIPADNYTALIIVLVTSGFCYGGNLLCGMALLPDTVEYSEWKLGNRSEGVQYGFNGFIIKCGSLHAGLIVGTGLDFTGYITNIAQSDSTPWGIRSLQSIVPGFLMLISVFIFLFYPITENMHKKICDELEIRKSEPVCK